MSSNNACHIRLAAFLLILQVVGCSGDKGSDGPVGTVVGTVTVEDKPLTEGAIVFFNDETADSFGAELDADGKFDLKEPIQVGKYQVSFSPPDDPEPVDETSAKLLGKNAVVHQGYQDGATSGFVAEVKVGENSLKFDLKRKGPPRVSGGEGMP